MISDMWRKVFRSTQKNPVIEPWDRENSEIGAHDALHEVMHADDQTTVSSLDQTGTPLETDI
jgi:hypothetical protein